MVSDLLADYPLGLNPPPHILKSGKAPPFSGGWSSHSRFTRDDSGLSKRVVVLGLVGSQCRVGNPGSIPGVSFDRMKLQIKLGVPRPLQSTLDIEKVKSVFPYGKIENVEVVDGGLICSSGVHVEEMGDKDDNCYIVNAAVYVGDLRACRDCRAFPGETCSSRHRLVIVDVLLGRRRRRREATRRPRILWKNLKGEAVETFRAIVSEKLTALEEDMSARNADQMWNTLASVIRDVAKESLGVASESARTHSTHRESWWFGEEVQTKVATKQSRFKELLACSDGNQEDIDLAKERYKVAKKEAKIAVAQAKDKAYEDLYRKLDSKEGANDIYKIAKARERKRMDIGNVRYIKDEGGRTIVREEDIRKRWGEYFSKNVGESIFSSLFFTISYIESRTRNGCGRHDRFLLYPWMVTGRRRLGEVAVVPIHSRLLKRHRSPDDGGLVKSFPFNRIKGVAPMHVQLL
ncbi:cleavage/polyadenylation specificity factor, 25kDa subunit [Tanacetum coccineum]